jgi:hypothetical protein
MREQSVLTTGFTALATRSLRLASGRACRASGALTALGNSLMLCAGGIWIVTKTALCEHGVDVDD